MHTFASFLVNKQAGWPNPHPTSMCNALIQWNACCMRGGQSDGLQKVSKPNFNLLPGKPPNCQWIYTSYLLGVSLRSLREGWQAMNGEIASWGRQDIAMHHFHQDPPPSHLWFNLLPTPIFSKLLPPLPYLLWHWLGKLVACKWGFRPFAPLALKHTTEVQLLQHQTRI